MNSQEIAFFDVTRTGELLSRLSEDTQIIKNAATTNLSEALRNFSTAFIGLSFMFATSWKLTCELFNIEETQTRNYVYPNQCLQKKPVIEMVATWFIHDLTIVKPVKLIKYFKSYNLLSNELT